MKKNLLIIILIFTICIFGVTFAYFGLTSNTNQEFKTDIFEASTYDTFVSPSNWQPGDTNEKIVNVKNIGNVDMAVRISLEEQWKSKSNQILSNTQNNESIAVINLVNTSDWIKEGNYYYYKYRLVKNDTTSNFMNRVTFNENINFDTNCIRVNNINNCSYTIGDYDGATYTLNIKIETIQYNKYKNVWNTSLTLLDEKPETGARTLVKKSNPSSITNYNNGNIHEMYTFNHVETEQTSALTDYRYIGNDPYNYVYFNCTDENDTSTCEVWRIIGVFDVERKDPDDENKTITESRIKLVRGSSFADTRYWDDRECEQYPSKKYGKNDWNGSLINIFLNVDYYNNLTNQAKNMINQTKYYLGASKYYSTNSFGDSDYIYAWERGTTVYNNTRPTFWFGTVALMYPSDVFITYANGVDDICYNTPHLCYNNNRELLSWIINSNYLENTGTPYKTWLLSSDGNNSSNVFILRNYLALNSGDNYNGVRPVVYLSSDVKIKSGTGASGDPYVLSI